MLRRVVVLVLLCHWDLLLGRVVGAVLVPVDLVDLELLGLMTKLGDLGCTEELLGAAALVVFKEAGGMGAVVGMEGPVGAGAGAMPGLEDLFDGESMAGAKGLELLEVRVKHVRFGSQGRRPDGSSQATS